MFAGKKTARGVIAQAKKEILRLGDDAFYPTDPRFLSTGPGIEYLCEIEPDFDGHEIEDNTIRAEYQAAAFHATRIIDTKAGKFIFAGDRIYRHFQAIYPDWKDEPKRSKPRHVVLTGEGKKFFENAAADKQGGDLIFIHDDGTAWGKSHQSRPLAEACGRAKIKPAISFHVLRHTHGSLLAMKGVPMPVIAKQLGHADTRMTEKHYAHLSPDYVADTIRENFPTLGIVEKSNVRQLKQKKR